MLAASVGDAWGADVQRRQEGNLVIEEIPPIPQEIVDRMVQYQNTRAAALQGWNPNGRGMLISTRFAETTQLHWVDQPGGARRQITFFTEPVRGAAICPDPSQMRFLFMKDVGGGEFYQIFDFDPRTGASRMLTDGKSRHGAVRWSNKGDRFSYYGTQRNGRDWDLYVASVEEGAEPTRVMNAEGAWTPLDFSPGDDRLLVKNYVSINESYLYVLDLGSGELTPINPSEEKIAYGAAAWAADGKGIFYTSDEAGEFAHLRFYDLATKQSAMLTADIPWDVEAVAVSKNRDRLAFTTNEDGLTKVYLLNADTRRRSALRELPIGQIYGLEFHPGGESLAMVVNTAVSPGDIYECRLKDQTWTRWTESEVGGLDTAGFVEPTLIHYETFDRVDGKPRKIPAFYYRPAKGKGPFPVLIQIHGGPEGQFVPYFSSQFQYWVNELNIAILAPNVRGSAGYGKSYLKLDNGFNREDTVKDIGKLLDWIAGRPELDKDRVAVTGGSYGGYMVLASMTHFNDRLRAGIESVGISNFVTFLQNTQDYRRELRRAEYGDERDPKMYEFLMKISPTTNAHKITKPMLIAQGLNDPRVPAGESEQIVAKIRSTDAPVWYVLAKDEGHGFSKKSNRDFYSHAVVLFLREHLLK
jgi:dipeptidyl aminopeptidase/acylaminoacyl peptidase